MKKVVITNAYTWYNKGDAGILLGIVNSLKEIYGKKIEINILSFTPIEDKKRYCKDTTIKNVYSSILNPYPYKYTFWGKKIAIVKLIIKMMYIYIMLKVNRKNIVKNNETLKILHESDVIIVCGGGFLGGKKYDSLMHLFQIYVNTLFKSKVVVMGTSIEPMNKGIIKKYTEKILKKVDYIFAREKITYNYLESFLDNNKFELIPDMAFMLEDYKETENKIDSFSGNYKYVIGITVRKWNFPNSSNSEKSMLNYTNTIVETIDYFNKKECIFVFIPQVIVENGNDIEVAHKIKERLQNKDGIIVIEDDLTPVELKGLISKCDIFVGTRMHSNIFATSMKVPTVAIAYEKKTNGIMGTVKLDEYVLEIDQINSNELINKVEKCLKNRETIKNNLSIIIPEIRKEIIDKLKEKTKNIDKSGEK